MTAHHAPGPWTYNATAGDHDYDVYAEATGRTVALVRATVPPHFHEGNARLIAAAPELLQALTVLLADTALNEDYQDDSTIAAIYDARAALAKAGAV